MGERETLTEVPLNAETRLRALREVPTPLDSFYVRSNFPVPEMDPLEWRLSLRGGNREPAFELGLEALRALPSVTRLVTLECAGNGRTFLNPAIEGTAWTLGGTSTARFTGTPLAGVLERAGVGPEVVEVLFTGADRGEEDGWGEIAFQRSLPVEAALGPGDRPDAGAGPILAWEMNGQPLPREHGGPVRLVVPGWYAVASVKWLTEIRLLTEPFQGFFQTDRYRYLREGEDPAPVQHMKVRALLLDPDPEGGTVPSGRRVLAGLAWSGQGEVTEVAVSLDGGGTWWPAGLSPVDAPHALCRWSLAVDLEPGVHEVVVRARDSAGNAQPLEQDWNALGYGNNAVQRVRLRTRSPEPEP